MASDSEKGNGVGRKMELLAPAGGMAAALTAFDSGADAVYCGLKSFNARERTENFSVEEMSKLIAHARKIGRKVYVTFNTLIKDPEIEAAATALSELDSLKPDAIIVQDLGVVRMARQFFPNLKIHASTQMGVHNSAGIALAKGMGIKRVILERQCTLGEISQMARTSPIELEVFIHGALCCCLSGSCMFSSWLGGWSGNRGKCKQPCRRRHYSENGNGFFFSTKDLCGLEAIPKLAELGIASLKIEGRLRKSDYVANVVTAYRMALDCEPDKFEAIQPSLRNILAKTYGRKWSLGFMTKESASDLIQHNSMGVAGLLCGKVVSTRQNGFEVSLSKRLHVGESIRVQPPSGDEGPSITITRMSVDGQPALKALQDGCCFIHCDKEVSNGSFVFKIGETTGDMQSRIDAMKLVRAGVDLDIHVSTAGVAVKAAGLEWKSETAFQSAEKRPLSEDAVKEEFAASASETFGAGNVKVRIDGKLFVPASVLKSIRREFWQWLEPQLTVESLKRDAAIRLEKLIDCHNAMKRQANPPLTMTAILPRGGVAPEGCISAREIMDSQGPKAGEEAILPYFVSEGELTSLEKLIAKAKASGVKVFRATSLFHFKLLKGLEGITVKTCLPLPCCNAFAAAELAGLGASQVQAWIELERAALEALVAKAHVPIEIYRYGRPPVLSTRATLSVEGPISDARGNKFFVAKKGVLTVVLPDRPMSIPEIEGASSVFDYREADPDEESLSGFNFNHVLS